MNCVSVKENLSAYIDGELEEGLENELKEHMEKCGGCRREYDELLEIAELLRAVPDVALPEEFDERLRTAIRKEKVREFSVTKKKWKMLSGVAAVFVIGIFSVTMYNQSNVPAPADAALVEFSARVLPIAQDEQGEGELLSRDIVFEAETTFELYLRLLDEELTDLDYRVVDSHVDEDGVWIFEVEINAVNESDEAYLEVCTYLGQDGKIWRKDLLSSTETAY